ncbi:MAG TPA: Gfo/Idh/MocA family oxidoreductase [Polyangiaceae bacterium]|nr:Gfo/Idh/MocA family oxidoreductase [Polyangiaceae bacterium]
MSRFTRRAFIQTGLLASASLTARSWARVPGANGDIRIAVVGLNGKGRDHVASYRSIPGVRVVALCDVDRAALDAAAQAAKAAGDAPQTFEDYRDLLAQKDIDAVSIVTPNHQHTLQAIWALRAGKDVFVEKPVSHDLWEGQQLLRAASKFPDRIVQAGTQNRSSPPIAQAIAWQRAGHIGKIKVARGLCYKRRESIGKTSGPQPVPKTVNYDLWLGPLPQAPLRRTKLHYDWHWQWATGNGDIGNQGNHQLDVARRFLGQAALPPSVSSVGGRLGYVDDGETPNTLIVSYDYPGAPLLFEVRGLPTQTGAVDAKPSAPAPVANTPGATWSPPKGSGAMDEYRGLSVGNIIECEGGYIVVPAGNYTSAQAFDTKGKLLQEWKGSASHYQNFIDAVKSRKAKDLNAPIIEGHVSGGLSHLANLSQQLGHGALAAEVGKALSSNARLSESFAGMKEHLRRNDIDVDKVAVQLGATLTLDPKTEKFSGEHAAGATRLSRHEYRQPFAVPEIV